MTYSKSENYQPGEWKKFQDMEWQKYQADYNRTGSAFGHFSVPEFHVTESIARELEKVEGPVLDIGCGVLPMPNYLRLATQSFGIDPYLGHRRKFPFAQAMGEWLPFCDRSFSACLLMSSLDHTYKMELVIGEARRILKENGLLFIWFISKEQPDIYHPWAFTANWLRKILKDDFIQNGHNVYPGDRQIGFPRTEMMVMRKE